jgi:hypothetical protein
MASNQNWKGRHAKNANLKNLKIYNKLKKEKPSPKTNLQSKKVCNL